MEAIFTHCSISTYRRSKSLYGIYHNMVKGTPFLKIVVGEIEVFSKSM